MDPRLQVAMLVPFYSRVEVEWTGKRRHVKSDVVRITLRSTSLPRPKGVGKKRFSRVSIRRRFGSLKRLRYNALKSLGGSPYARRRLVHKLLPLWRSGPMRRRLKEELYRIMFGLEWRSKKTMIRKFRLRIYRLIGRLTHKRPPRCVFGYLEEPPEDAEEVVEGVYRLGNQRYVWTEKGFFGVAFRD